MTTNTDLPDTDLLPPLIAAFASVSQTGAAATLPTALHDLAAAASPFDPLTDAALTLYLAVTHNCAATRKTAMANLEGLVGADRAEEVHSACRRGRPGEAEQVIGERAVALLRFARQLARGVETFRRTAIDDLVDAGIDPADVVALTARVAAQSAVDRVLVALAHADTAAIPAHPPA